MKENKIKKANTSPEGQAGSENMSTADVDAVMKKYDRESNIRVWTGKYKLAVRGLLVAFSLWCIYVTLFATFLEEIRLTSFLGLIILIGFLTYPAKKGDIRENYMPIGDIIFMIAGAGAFLYFTFSANQIINQGTRFAPYCGTDRAYQTMRGPADPVCGRFFPDLCTGCRAYQSGIFRKSEIPGAESFLHKRGYFLHTCKCML